MSWNCGVCFRGGCGGEEVGGSSREFALGEGLEGDGVDHHTRCASAHEEPDAAQGRGARGARAVTGARCLARRYRRLPFRAPEGHDARDRFVGGVAVAVRCWHRQLVLAWRTFRHPATVELALFRILVGFLVGILQSEDKQQGLTCVW